MRAQVGLPKLHVPECYLADYEGGIIIMENLRKNAYCLFNKLSGKGTKKAKLPIVACLVPKCSNLVTLFVLQN